MIIANLSKEERERLFRFFFGDWQVRSELNAVLFPGAKSTKIQSSSMTQLINRGKSSRVIAATIKLLLSIEPMAGKMVVEHYGEDRAALDEFKTDMEEFFMNAKEYFRMRDTTGPGEKIAAVAEMISDIAISMAPDTSDFPYARRAMEALLQGMTAFVGTMHSIPFPLMEEISFPIRKAIDASSKYCSRATIEMLRNMLLEKMECLWKHAVGGPREAKDSFEVYSRLMGEKVPLQAIEAFCAVSRSASRGKMRPPHYQHRTRSQ